MRREPWDYEKALEEDRKFERGLIPKEFVVFLLVLGVLAIRVFLS